MEGRPGEDRGQSLQAWSVVLCNVQPEQTNTAANFLHLWQ